MVTCKSENQNYKCVLNNNKMKIYSDAPPEKGGKYEGFRPHELLESAFASCLNITIRMIADKKNIKLTEIISKVSVNNTNSDKTKFIYSIDIKGNLNKIEKKYYLMNLNIAL